MAQTDGRAGRLAKIGAVLCFVAASAFLLLSHSAARARTDAPVAGVGSLAHGAR